MDFRMHGATIKIVNLYLSTFFIIILEMKHADGRKGDRETHDLFIVL
jgi:hypothetical protein